jgi:hypothetical protein
MSPAEVLQLLKSLSFAENTDLVHNLQIACRKQLLESTNLKQLKELCTVGYLNERSSARDVIIARIQFYEQTGCEHPGETLALDTFLRVHRSITQILRDRKISDLQSLTENLACAIQSGKIDSRLDIVFLSIFCAMRKHVSLQV